MDTYSSTDAKREFGEVLMKSQRAPVRVTRNGKPIAIVVSEAEYRQLKLQALHAALPGGGQSGDAGVPDMAAIKEKVRIKAGLLPNSQDT